MENYIDISVNGGQNTAAKMIAGYLTAEEIGSIDIKSMNNFWRQHKSGYHNSKDAIDTKGIIYEQHFDFSGSDFTIAIVMKSKIERTDLSPIDYLVMQIQYRKMFNVDIKIEPNPHNPIYISKVLCKASNCARYEMSRFKLYNIENLQKQFINSLTDLCFESYDQIDALKEFKQILINRKNFIFKRGINFKKHNITISIDPDYLADFRFSIHNETTHGEEFFYLEKNVEAEKYRVITILNAVIKNLENEFAGEY